MEKIVWVSCILLSLYWLLPVTMTLVCGFGVCKRGCAHREVAFTFDDGPDPIYTPQLLKLLQKYKVKATFFVLGSKAETHPELIHRIHQEGHLIGVHNFRHSLNWLMAPWTVRRQLNRSAEIIERITGERPIYYRPTWGLLTLFDIPLQKQYQIILWSLMVGDWWSRGGSLKIKKRLLKRVKGGDIILLHDSGTTWGANLDAPLHTIAALEEVLEDIFLQGYKCVRVDDLTRLHALESERKISWRKSLLIRLWMIWEKLFHTCFRICSVDENNRILQVRVRIYKGETIRLSDGEEIRRGDRVAELHFDNELLLKMSRSSRSSVQLAIQLIRATEQVLPKITRFILCHPNHQEIKGVYGISIIHRGTKQFGFTVTDLPKGLFSCFAKLYLKLLLLIVHPKGKQRLQTKTELLVPKMIAMSTKELISKYQINNFLTEEGKWPYTNVMCGRDE